MNFNHLIHILITFIDYLHLMSIFGQPLMFPQGFFDMKKLKAKDAIYLNLLALSGLEHGGTTFDEINELSKIRYEENWTDHSESSSLDSANLSNKTEGFANESTTVVNSTTPAREVIESSTINVQMLTVSHNVHLESSKNGTFVPKYPFDRLHDGMFK